ncbi:MAG TPA: hypothetical protein PLG15_07325 [Candidatus Gastranaerophilaceae bacterium]|mgnify:CR=1 FL=1|nr:hypothetical protein [Candidatus Gastranaerophilaceae bacterium]HPT42179.1 hypothetical protein [Candidatus Gastranaerophilaceae bacterium]
MSYRYDSYLVIANKFSSAGSDAKAQLFETYDRLRDLTVSGSAATGTGFEQAGGFLYQVASLFSPSSFMTTMGGTSAMNIPGTSYWSPVSGGNAVVNGGYSAFGIGGLGNYSGFPGGAANINLGLGDYTGGASSILSGFGSMQGSATGFASSIGGIADVASAAAYGAGMGSGYGFGTNVVLPIAGVISGWGGIMQAAAPYLGEYGLPAIVMGNLMQGTTSAALSAYQNVSGRILSNADSILTNKVRNIETVCKMLDTQGDVVRKMLKESIDSDSKAIQNL